MIKINDVLRDLRLLAFMPLDDEDCLIRPSDKIRALELIGKHLKIFTDRLEVSGEGSEPITITSDMSQEEATRNYLESIAYVPQKLVKYAGSDTALVFCTAFQPFFEGAPYSTRP